MMSARRETAMAFLDMSVERPRAWSADLLADVPLPKIAVHSAVGPWERGVVAAVGEAEVVEVGVEGAGVGLGAGPGAGAGEGIEVGDGAGVSCAPREVMTDTRTNESSRSGILLLFCMKPIL